MNDRSTAEGSVYQRLDACLAPAGLCVRGGVHFHGGGPVINSQVMKSIVLVGYVGATYWPHFERFRAQHAKPDPLDSWSRQIIEPIAKVYSGTALYPFEKPWWPFQTWIAQSEGLKASPLGMLIHPEYGLWHGYRGAIGFESIIDLPVLPKVAHPCDRCDTKPCITDCPAHALGSGQFQVDACRRFLARETDDGGCLTEGCASRNACPVGGAYRFQSAQQRFHMDALSLPPAD